MRTLIVDDHEGFRSAARALLERAGHDVIGEADDGESALTEYLRFTPDLVVLDLQLPDTDGFAVAVALSRVAEPPAVVLVTARRVKSDLTRAATAPVRGLLRKDEFTQEALAALLRRTDG